MDLVDIAEKLGISAGTIRGWKSKDKWDSRLNGTFQTNERSVPKHTERSKQRRERSKPLPEPVVESEELTDKQRLFVMEYMRDFNATRAAIAVGYSKKTAYAIGWELLRKPQIQAEIKRLKEVIADELGLDIKRVIAEYMKIAFTDITDLLDFGQREVQVMGPFGPLFTGKGKDKKPVTKIVNFVDFKESGKIDGTVISEVKQGKDGVSIKLHDKLRALKELEKYLDYMTEEERLKLDKLRAEVKALEGPKEEESDDGFLEALKGKAAEVWDEETENEEKQSLSE